MRRRIGEVAVEREAGERGSGALWCRCGERGAAQLLEFVAREEAGAAPRPSAAAASEGSRARLDRAAVTVDRDVRIQLVKRFSAVRASSCASRAQHPLATRRRRPGSSCSARLPLQCELRTTVAAASLLGKDASFMPPGVSCESRGPRDSRAWVRFRLCHGGRAAVSLSARRGRAPADLGALGRRGREEHAGACGWTLR